jgi:PAS domain S-box-containing protein
VWLAGEPWLEALRALAPGPGALLAELSDWAALLDRHSAVSFELDGLRTRVRWENVGVPADARECAFRLGALAALIGAPALGVAVSHVRCRARGDSGCWFVVEGIEPLADERHAQAFREARRLAAMVASREEWHRRLAALEAPRDGFPDLRDARATRRFIEELPDPVIIFDRSLRVIDANLAALRLSGTTLDELRGGSARDLVEGEEFRAVERWLPELFERGWQRGMLTTSRTRGGPHWFEFSARLAANGQTIAVTARDVSAARRLELELEQRNRELLEQNERIAEADRLKSEFLANISHELTTPLTSIKGFARMLLGDARGECSTGEARLSPAQRTEFAAIVAQEAERMLELIRGLLELSHIDSGATSLERSRVALNAIVRESLLVLKPRLDEAGHAVELALDPALPPSLLDPDRIKQVVLNLLENAAKFSPARSEIRVLTSGGAGEIQLAVENPCAELEERDLDRIFERFVQRDGGFSRAHGGVGLGLNLVRSIVQLHGGSVRAELPAPGRFRVVVSLPA